MRNNPIYKKFKQFVGTDHTLAEIDALEPRIVGNQLRLSEKDSLYFEAYWPSIQKVLRDEVSEKIRITEVNFNKDKFLLAGLTTEEAETLAENLVQMRKERQ